MVAGYLLIVRAIGFDPTQIMPALAGGLLFGGVAGLLAIVVPAGLGVRDGVLAWILLGWVPAPSAVVLSLVAHVWLTAGDVLVVLVAAGVRLLDRQP